MSDSSWDSDSDDSDPHTPDELQTPDVSHHTQPNLQLSDRTITTRGYQQEMLEESLKGNVILAMPTGSGKTHVAVLRMKVSIDRELSKVCWFLAPTVSLCEQQKRVIETALPVSVGLISGANEPEHWKDRRLWGRVLTTNRVVVSTPQVLLDACLHRYINLGRDISLLVFDECHAAQKDHPYNRIMKEVYFKLPPRSFELSNVVMATVEDVRPAILGLTASPIYGGDVSKAFEKIEKNLDSKIRAPLEHKEELDRHVYKPVYAHKFYDTDPSPFSSNLYEFEEMVESLDIEDDPYVLRLRKDLANTPRHSSKWQRIDQTLSKTIQDKDTYTLNALRDVSRTASALCTDIGPWAADWLVYESVTQAKAALDDGKYGLALHDLPHQEKAYLLNILQRVSPIPPSDYPADVVDETSDKLRVLVEAILKEKAETEADNQTWNSLVFVQRREAVMALAAVLRLHPQTKDIVKVGCLVGTTDTSYRTAALDLTKSLLKTHSATLEDFKTGQKNLIISTAVAEEGIDIQACGSVIRWDPPMNMASWLQSRGRARRQKSKFTLLVGRGAEQAKMFKDWEQMEEEMVAQYSDPARQMKPILEDDEDLLEEHGLEFRVPSTGAVLTLHSAIPHLNHFCAVIPGSNHNDFRAIYEIDPPEFLEGWHSFNPRTTGVNYNGPWAAKVTLPRVLPPELRYFTTERIHHRKESALRHVAFMAYKALYESELLSDNLLPLSSVVEPHLDEEVQELLKEVERREGTALVSLQMNPWAGDGPWYASELSISGVLPLYMFTRSKPVSLTGSQAPILHEREGARSVTWQPLQTCVDEETVTKARDYTRRLFWTMNGSRMRWDDLDFSYLFLPVEDHDPVWDARRSWYAASEASAWSPLLCMASAFVEQFAHADDLVIVRNGPQFGKAFKFLEWRTQQLSQDEEAEVRARYSYSAYFKITYPILVGQPLPPRTNFLVPLPAAAKPAKAPEPVNLLVDFSTVALCSNTEFQYATLLPSALRALEMAVTVVTMRDTMLAGTALAEIPLNLLTMAVCAPMASEHFNYERLETLGDTVLKFMTSIQLLGQYPLWHEGYLTKKMGHSVSNARLAKANIGHGLYKWIIRDRLIGKKWKPSYNTVAGEPETPPDNKKDPKKKKKANSQELSTKLLADVVEALIGASYLHGSFDLSVQMAEIFDLGVKWAPLPSRVTELLNRVEIPDDAMLPAELDTVERMLDYTFQRKMLLVEALTHLTYSHDSELRTISYERLEFCGDAVLDMIVSDYLYRSNREYSPGQMYYRKCATVNQHTLAYICLKTKTQLAPSAIPKPDRNTSRFSRTINIEEESRTVHLHRCMMHSNLHIFQEQTATAERFEARREDIETALQSGRVFPWTPLFLLQAPKFLSDLIESLIGAVYLDSNGDLDVVRRVLRTLGLLQILERIVADDVDVMHPVSRLSMWASKKHAKLKFNFVHEEGRISCVVEINGEEKDETRTEDAYTGRMTKLEVRLVAADKANALCDGWTLKKLDEEGEDESKKRKRTLSDSGSPTTRMVP
uniref:P-loop containing nucleoside triphosphate hydrolase protein n=1 Tax=Mycena chlorophos TaxID=658473 RepID=A0ABQ0MBM4_MYCCL|nr:predicted protein [Mycena chlorophos]